MKMATHAMSMAPVESVKSPIKSGNELIGGEESRFLIFSKVLSILINSLLALLSSSIGSIDSERIQLEESSDPSKASEGGIPVCIFFSLLENSFL